MISRNWYNFDSILDRIPPATGWVRPTRLRSLGFDINNANALALFIYLVQQTKHTLTHLTLQHASDDIGQLQNFFSTASTSLTSLDYTLGYGNDSRYDSVGPPERAAPSEGCQAPHRSTQPARNATLARGQNGIATLIFGDHDSLALANDEHLLSFLRAVKVGHLSVCDS